MSLLAVSTPKPHVLGTAFVPADVQDLQDLQVLSVCLFETNETTQASVRLIHRVNHANTMNQHWNKHTHSCVGEGSHIA